MTRKSKSTLILSTVALTSLTLIACCKYSSYSRGREIDIHNAILSHDLGRMRSLLKSGSSIESRYSSPDHDPWATEITPLMSAISQNNLPAMELLISNGADVDAVDRLNHSALAHAAHWGNEAAFFLLIEHGAKRRDAIVLSEVAANGTVKMLNEVLKAKPGAEDLGFALIAACSKGNGETARLLIGNGADVNFHGYAMSIPPLEFAAIQGQEAIINLLLVHGAQVDFQNDNGQTALASAAEYGQANAVAALLKRGANPRIHGSRSLPPLALCAMNGNAVAMELLLQTEAGGDIEWRRDDGATPLILAAWFGDSGRVRAILRAGANISAHLKDGRTALDCGKKRGDKEGQRIVEVLEAAQKGRD